MTTEFTLNAIRFEDVRRAVITFLEENNQYKGELDFDGSNLGYFIDVVSYYTMLQSYQNTLLSNNIFIDTTEIRKNAISIAKNMGYRPKRKVASRFTGTIEYYGDTTASPAQVFVSGDTITIPARTEFTSGSYTFINKVPITLTYQNSALLSGDFIVYEGSFKKVVIYGTGEKYQSYVIPSENVEDGSLTVSLRTSNTSTSNNVLWTQADSFFTTIDDNIFFVEEDIVNEYRPKIIFGDGIVGNIPATTETITIEYLETSGSTANGQSSLSFSSTPSASETAGSGSTFTFNVDDLVIDLPANQVSYGGKTNESLVSIQFNAPRFFASGGRGVTAEDLKVLLSEYESTLKYYNVIGGNTLFPNDSSQLGVAYITAVSYFTEDEGFLLNESVYLSEIEENEILPDLISKSVISTIRRFLKPTYLYLSLNPYVEVPSSYSDGEIESTISAAYTAIKLYRDTYLKGLGKSFRTARLRASLTNTLGVTTADIDITHYFGITDESLYNSRKSMMSLPIIYQKSNTGQILYDTNNNPLTENFIKKRETIISKENESRTIANAYTQFTLPISKSSIYGALRHKNSNRYLYNIDVSRVEVLTFQEEGATGQEFISYVSKSFTDQSGVEWTSNLYENGTDSWQIQLNGRHIAQLKKTGSSYSIYQPDQTFLGDTIGVVSETNNSVITWISIDSITETDVSNNTETFYSISFLLSNTTYTDVRIFSETKLGDAVFDAETFTWTWTNTATLLDSNNADVTFSPLVASAADEENFLTVVYADATTDILVSVKNYNGSFSLNNFNKDYLQEFDQRNDFKLESDYTLERNDISLTDNAWEASKVYVLENSILCSSNYICECTTAGTSGTTEPAWPATFTYGTTVSDGSVAWTLVSDTDSGMYIDYEFSAMAAPTAAFEQIVTLNAEKGFKITIPTTKNNTEVSRAGYQSIGLAMTATDVPALPTLTYKLLINGVSYDVAVNVADDFEDIKNTIDTVISADGYTCTIEGTAPAEDIRITHDTIASGSDISITDGVTSGLLAAFVAGGDLTSPVAGTKVTGYGIGIGQMASKWFNLYSANNATHYYVWLRNGVHESSTFTCIADVAGALNNDYVSFEVISEDGATVTKYHAWYSVNAAGVDPAPTGSTGIKVSIGTGATASTVATATKTAIDTANIDVTVGISTAELTIENDYPGLVTNALSVNSTAFTGLIRNAIGDDATDPTPDIIRGESWTALPVLIRTGDSYTAIATKIAEAITLNADFTATVLSNVVTVSLAKKGKNIITDGDSSSESDKLLYKSIFGTIGYALLVSPFNDSSTAFTFAVDAGAGQAYAGYNIDVNINRIIAGDFLVISSTTDSANTGTFLVKEIGTELRYDLYAADGTLKSKDVGSTCVPTGTDVIKTFTVPDGTITIYNKSGVLAVDGVGSIQHHTVTDGVYGSHIVHMLDIFHDVSVGTLNYDNGELIFNENIKGYTDYETSSPTSTDTKGYYPNQHTLMRGVKSVFSNYGQSWDTATNKIDIIKIVPIDKYTNTGVFDGQLNDFDTLFNQCLQINISNPIIKI